MNDQNENDNDNDNGIEINPYPFKESASINDINDEFINNECINIVEYHIILHPDTRYQITLVNDIQYTIDNFEAKIISQLREDYPEFDELSNLKVIQYLKEDSTTTRPKTNNTTYTPISIDSFSSLPNPLYVQMTSSDVWVKLDCNIEFNINHSIQTFCEIRLERNSTWKQTEPMLMKALIHLWNRACIDNSELLQYHYIVKEYTLLHTFNQKDIWLKETQYNFAFQLSAKFIMRSIEELAFHSMQDEFKNVTTEVKWEIFRNLKSFDHFAYCDDLEYEFDLLKTRVRSEIFKLNKVNKIYLFFSTNKLDEDEFDLSSSSSSEGKTIKREVNLVISPIITKDKERMKRNPNQNSSRFTFEYLSPKLSIPSSTIQDSHQKKSLSRTKNYQELILDENIFQLNDNYYNYNARNKKDKDSNDEYIYEPAAKPFKVKHSIEGLNFAAKKLYKCYLEEQLVPVKEVNETKPPKQKKMSTKKAGARKEKINQIESMEVELFKVITQTYVLNLIENNSEVKMQKMAFEKYTLPKIRAFSSKQYFSSSIKSYKEKSHSHSYFYNWGGYLFLIVLLALVAIILYISQ